MTTSASFQTPGLGGQATLLSSMKGRLGRELRPRLRDAGELVADEARANARRWPNGGSKRIPGAISVRSRLAGLPGATVVVSAKAAPHARPYEGIDGNSTFRHPIPNGKRWVTEKTRPYLKPAARAKARDAGRLVEEALKASMP